LPIVWHALSYRSMFIIYTERIELATTFQKNPLFRFSLGVILSKMQMHEDRHHGRIRTLLTSTGGAGKSMQLLLDRGSTLQGSECIGFSFVILRIT